MVSVRIYSHNAGVVNDKKIRRGGETFDFRQLFRNQDTTDFKIILSPWFKSLLDIKPKRLKSNGLSPL